MKYVAFIATDGPQPEETVALMNRDFPAYFEEMDRRGVRLFGRELDFPQTAVTVSVRDSETLVTDGPFVETKEFVGGFDLLECADLDEAIEVEGKSPVARFLPFEIRPVREGLLLGAGASAFGQSDDSAGIPYLLMVWVAGTTAGPLDDESLMRECDAWRRELEGRGVFVLGSALGGPETATTLRFHGGEMQLSDGPFLGFEEFIAGIEVVTCADRRQAIEFAATHPLARYHAIEARPFYERMTTPVVQRAVDAAFSEEWGRVVAALISRTGDWDLTEECTQEAFAEAVALAGRRRTGASRRVVDDRRR